MMKPFDRKDTAILYFCDFIFNTALNIWIYPGTQLYFINVFQPLFMPRDNQSEATSASNKSSPHNQQTDIGESQSGTADSEISKHTVCPPELESRADNHQNIRTEGSAFHQCEENPELELFSTNKSSYECGVCLSQQSVLCVLLPCRHSCICLHCFKQLNRQLCPFCQSPYDSYFYLSGNGKEGISSEEEIMEDLHREAVRYNIRQMWETFNLRLNHLVGFR